MNFSTHVGNQIMRKKRLCKMKNNINADETTLVLFVCNKSRQEESVCDS